ncbi:archaeosine synthase subunit alpha [Methanoregula sp.]|uniref:archaeosine synthase subunit alpha n=1 Tax=Methanoregula sp. TaxID=2052170 RepID=UPI00356176EB
MTRYNIRKRDGLARTGILESDAGSHTLPAVLDAVAIFPDLTGRQETNVPISAPASFVLEFLHNNGNQPVSIHPKLDNPAVSGDCVMVASWHTAFANPRSYADWLIALKEKTPVDTAWFAPGAALPSNAAILVYSGFDLFDYVAVDLKSAQGIFCTADGEFSSDALSSGICTCPGCKAGDLREHNREALRHELALVRKFIAQSQLRDLIESRCRMDAAQVAIMRHLDRNYSFMEQQQPIARGGVMRANSAESMQRAEVRRFAERVVSRYIPPKTDVAVLLPCSARKPYSLSQSHRRFQQAVGGRAHELIVTSPLGLVPRELETVYPAGHYDVPVTGYWDAEECAVIADILIRYFQRNQYRRVIAHLEGGALKVARMAAEACGITLECTCEENPTGDAALNHLDAALAGERRIKDDRLHGMISYQFGCDVDTKGTTLRGHFPEVFYSRNNVQVFSIDTVSGMLRPTLDGWNLIQSGYRVYIDDFIPEGDVLMPGVSSADPGIRDGDEVLVIGKRALAAGKAALPSEDISRSKRGVAVRVRKIKRL